MTVEVTWLYNEGVDRTQNPKHGGTLTIPLRHHRSLISRDTDTAKIVIIGYTF